MRKKEYHTVQKGDTLVGIARRYYNGNGAMWERIYNANRAIIQNPETLVAGQVLVVPRG